MQCFGKVLCEPGCKPGIKMSQSHALAAILISIAVKVHADELFELGELYDRTTEQAVTQLYKSDVGTKKCHVGADAGCNDQPTLPKHRTAHLSIRKKNNFM